MSYSEHGAPSGFPQNAAQFMMQFSQHPSAPPNPLPPPSAPSYPFPGGHLASQPPYSQSGPLPAPSFSYPPPPRTPQPHRAPYPPEQYVGQGPPPTAPPAYHYPPHSQYPGQQAAPPPPPPAGPSSSQSAGAQIMALLGGGAFRATPLSDVNQRPQSPFHPPPATPPQQSQVSSEASAPYAQQPQAQDLAPSAPPLSASQPVAETSVQPQIDASSQRVLGSLAPMQLPATATWGQQSRSSAPESTKKSSGRPLNGRVLSGKEVVVDVTQLPEGPPRQLEVAPITMINTELNQTFGTEIAANNNYICYGLRQGQMRVLKRDTAARTLLRGHSTPVLDIKFFADTVDLIGSVGRDNNVFVRRVGEVDSNVQDHVLLSINVTYPEESGATRFVWHPFNEGLFAFASGNSVCLVSVNVAANAVGPADGAAPALACDTREPPTGVTVLAGHSAAVTDVAFSTGGARLASSSLDGSVRLWDSAIGVCTATFSPHDAAPVTAVLFAPADSMPHGLLMTGGRNNQEWKLWTTEPARDTDWQCTQTVGLKAPAQKSGSGGGDFFNHAMLIPSRSLLLLANTLRKELYSLHLRSGVAHEAAYFDYFAAFAVTMPMLSVAAIADSQQLSSKLHLFSVQTQAIQQYTLDVTECLPSEEQLESAALVLEPSPSTAALIAGLPSTPAVTLPITPVAPIAQVAPQEPQKHVELQPESASLSGNSQTQAAVAELSEATERASSPAASSTAIEQTAAGTEPVLTEPSIVEVPEEAPMLPALELLHKAERPPSPAPSSSGVKSPPTKPILLTPTAILSRATAAQAEATFKAESSASAAADTVEEMRVADVAGEVAANIVNEPVCEPEPVPLADAIPSSVEPAAEDLAEPSGQDAERETDIDPIRKQKNTEVELQATLAAAPSQNAFAAKEAGLSVDDGNFKDVMAQVAAMVKEMAALRKDVNAMVTAQNNIVKQLPTLGGPLLKELKRIEQALSTKLDKALKVNVDSLAARFEEERQKREKLDKEKQERLLTAVSANINRDLPLNLEKMVRRELATIAPTLEKTLTPALQTAFATNVTDMLQKLVAEKVMPQIEKALGKQLPTALQASVRQPLQESIRNSFQIQLLPAVESAVRAMFEQMDATLQAGLREHSSATATGDNAALNDALCNARAIIDSLTTDLAASQRQLVMKALEIASQAGSAPSVSSKGMVSVDPDVIFDQSETRLNQGVVLALVQQLSADLTRDAQLKLDWMQRAAVTLNPRDPLFGPHMRQVLQPVYDSLQAYINSGAAGSRTSSVRIICHVVNSLLSDCP
eukprot:jgi/Chlat1/6275/Chrsp44S00453